MTIESTTTQSTVEEARERAERIRTGMNSLHAMRTDIADAYLAMDWNSLGYDSWESYVESEFVSAKLRLPREQRRELVGTLEAAGMSRRAIAAAVGTTHGTVNKDISAGARNHSPDYVPYSSSDEQRSGGQNYPRDYGTSNGSDEQRSRSVKGRDGKPYTKPPVSDLISGDQLAELNGNSTVDREPIDAEIVEDKPMPATKKPELKPRRKAIAATARSVGLDGTSWTRKMRNLLNDDRFNRNRDAVGNAMRAEVDEVHRAVNEFKKAVDGTVYEPR